MTEKKDTDMQSATSPYISIDQLDEGEILHVASGTKISFDQLVDILAPQRAIYLGETHDNIAAHQVQLRIIEAMYRRQNTHIAIGMEMFRYDVQDKLDLLKMADMSMDDFNQLFEDQWGWRSAYQPILDFIYQNRLDLVGLKPSKEIENVVREGGQNAETPELILDDAHHRPYYMPFFEKSRGEGKAERSYRIMTLWDEMMAENVAKFLTTPKIADMQMIVIAGTGHINYGFGIPHRAYRRVPHAFVTLLPLSDDSEADAPPLKIADYVWKVPYDKTPAKRDGGSSA